MTDPFEHIRSAPAGLLFICDHASNALPEGYGSLGLDRRAFETHIAYDIGAAHVTRALAGAFRAPAILARWSRLLIDLNRGSDDPTLIMKLSDGRLVPGNCDLSEAEAANRLRRFYAPYHDAIESEIELARAGGLMPALISVHSFTPIWKNLRRPWEIGILWDRDDRLAKPLMAALMRAGLVVGDNEPYSGELEGDCLFQHGTQNGLPHVLIEIRQDLVLTPASAIAFASRLKPILENAMAAMGAAEIRFSRPLRGRTGAQIMDDKTGTELEAAVFRRLVAPLRERNDIPNHDLMKMAGFCRQ